MIEKPSAAVPAIVVTIPYNSKVGFILSDQSGWSPVSAIGITVNESIFPRAKWIAYEEQFQIANRDVLSSRLYVLDQTSAFLEISIDFSDHNSLVDSQLNLIYRNIYEFHTSANHALFSWASSKLGDNAKLAWQFTIGCVCDSEGDIQPDLAQSLIGPAIETKDFRNFSSSPVRHIVIGETGAWVAMGKNATPESFTVAKFWVSRIVSAFSTVNFMLETLMEQRRSILKTRHISPGEYDKFLNVKQEVVGLIFKLSPGSNATEWIDIQIYSIGFNAWGISNEKDGLLAMLDRLEGVISSLEERRVRRNSFLVSLLINIITITGLFAVLDYFVNFSGRQGIDMTMALSLERQAVFVVLGLISLIALFFTVRNR